MDRFADKVAIVTGGASGIGQAICRYLGRHSARVIVADRDRAGAQATGSQIVACGGSARAVRVDVTDRQSVQALIEDTARDDGGIDLLFNNAGIGLNGEFQDFTLEDWKQILDINLWGVIYGCHYAYPIMIRQGHGHIVNTASLAGLIPGGLTTPYSTSKYAVVGFTLTLRAEARQYGIKVSALCPGYMRTNIQKTSKTVSTFMVSERNEAMNATMRFPTAAECIVQIMKGVERNRGIIIAPRLHGVFWWLNRALPEFNPRMWSMVIRHMKKEG